MEKLNMNQKEIKALKKRIVDEGALNVGYFQGAREAILKAAPDILEKVLQTDIIDQLLFLVREERPEFDTLFVSEAVRLMSYSEFKTVAHYFFSYERTEAEIMAQPIEISRAHFERLQASGQQQFKEQRTNLMKSIEQLTTEVVSNGREPIAYNPFNESLAVLENSDWQAEPYFDDYLLSDYRYPESEGSRLVTLLAEHPREQRDGMITGLNRLLGEQWQDQSFGNSLREGGLSSDNISAINDILGIASLELITHEVVGYHPSEQWQLYYVYEKSASLTRETDLSHINDYLEHAIGAYYRGSLTELKIYNRENDVAQQFTVDREQFVGKEIEQTRKLLNSDDWVSIELGLRLQNIDEPVTRDLIEAIQQETNEDQQMKK